MDEPLEREPAQEPSQVHSMAESGREWMVDVFVPESRFPGPRWKRRLLLDLVLSFCPTETWRSRRNLREDKREQGAAAGHMFGQLQYARQHLWSQLPDEIRQEVLRAMEVLKGKLKDWLDNALDAPLEDATPFFSGFANALKRGSFDEAGNPAGRRGDEITYQIKLMLVKEWDEVEKLRVAEAGTPALTKFLLTKLPAHISEGHEREPALSRAFQKRIEKICERCGLSMGRRGAPKKRNSPA